MLDRRRRLVTPRFAPAHATPRARGGARHRGRSRILAEDLFAVDHAESRQGGRFRWLFSTCLAAAVATFAITVVIYGSMDHSGTPEGLIPTFTKLGDTDAQPLAQMLRRREGLRWTAPRSDRLEVNVGATSTRYVIRESRTERRGGRKYTANKPYVRIVSRLAPVPTDFDGTIPTFNPYKLYADSVGSAAAGLGGGRRKDVQIRVVELPAGTLTTEDGQQMQDADVQELVEKALEPERLPAPKSIGDDGALDGGKSDPGSTAIVVKNVLGAESEDDDVAQLSSGGVSRVYTIAEGDTLTKVLMRVGAEAWQARNMVDAASTIFPDGSLAVGQEVRVSLVPSLTRQNVLEPVRFSVYEGKTHKISVTLDESGEYVPSATPPRKEISASTGSKDPSKSTLYASVYHSGLMEQLTPDTINQVLRVHAYETDFSRKLRAGDAVEFFCDLKDENDADAPPGEVLYSAVTAGGQTTRFYRYRTKDGQVEFYDSSGNNSKRFLMRMPVRGNDVRLTSGFGYRVHPLLKEGRMHTGIDWAAAPGTPILAAGNGVIEEAGRKGQYGNYVRIRHANGYQTAYGHMVRIGDGVAVGVKVRQGQVIGYVGSTGMSSGPHLHYEVLVNTRFIDPFEMTVPRERQLEGRELMDFQRERTRIDELMRRAPVKTVRQ